MYREKEGNKRENSQGGKLKRTEFAPFAGDGSSFSSLPFWVRSGDECCRWCKKQINNNYECTLYGRQWQKGAEEEATVAHQQQFTRHTQRESTLLQMVRMAKTVPSLTHFSQLRPTRNIGDNIHRGCILEQSLALCVCVHVRLMRCSFVSSLFLSPPLALPFA